MQIKIWKIKINKKNKNKIIKYNYFKNLEKLPTFCEKSVETPPKNSLTKELALIKAYKPPI
mgnify:CR=1 FL=1